MKKKYVLGMLAVCMLALSACGKTADTASVDECSCKHCRCCTCQQEEQVVVNADEDFEAQSSEKSEVELQEDLQTEPVETQMSTETTEQETMTQDGVVEEEKPVSQLSEGEKAARKALQANLAQAREELYALPNSIEKTQKINEIDKQILENNAVDFSNMSIQFFGDSITEGICGKVDEGGRFVSFVNYANDYLKFGTCMNHGKAGRMFSDYGGQELSLSLNMGNMFNNSANVSVIFLGANDYLTDKEGKRYGDINAPQGTAGYIGSLYYTMRNLKANYPNQEIFFVTMYNISRTSNSTYTDVAGSPQLGDYMDVLRQIVSQNGYHLIELYNTGFMDCTDSATDKAYLADGIHPMDSGNKVLGEHIAAELSLYYGQK